jgi:hypothetical protein
VSLVSSILSPKSFVLAKKQTRNKWRQQQQQQQQQRVPKKTTTMGCIGKQTNKGNDETSIKAESPNQ